jgi:23S rRNA-/tRNA-specific pseudouridylate synthase
VVVLAKNETAFLHLKAQFHDRLAEKEYRAFVYGALTEERGIINRPIARSAKDFRLRSAQRGARGEAREAITHWECIAFNETHSYVRLMPKTGRTHQLRVHMKAINHPIVCDKLYAPNHPCDLGFSRVALHASALTLVCPDGVRRTFEAPLPIEFLNAEAIVRGA